MNKIICLDASAFMFNAIYLQGSMTLLKREGKLNDNTFIAPINYTYFSMIISCLKRIGIDREDTIIITIDARNSFRKAFYPIYKGQRKKIRDKQSHIDWDKCWADIKKINNQLNESTNWHFLKFDNVYTLDNLLQTKEGKELIGDDYEDWQREKDYGLESDDIQAIVPLVFSDKETIIVTCDKDLYQLKNYDNAKIWSLNLKKIKSGKGGYATIKDPLKIIADKVRLGDISDNIIVDKLHDTELEQRRRRFIIDLLNLPDWVENEIRVVLEDLPKKEEHFDKLPFQKSLALRFPDIYKRKNVVTYQYCMDLQEKREKIKKEKARIKYYEKKGLPVPNKVIKVIDKILKNKESK